MAGAGIVSGFDMTSEAALAKLSYVLGQPGLSLDGKKEVPLGLWVWGHVSQGSRGHGEGCDLGRPWGPVKWGVCLDWKGGRGAGPPCRGKVQLWGLGSLHPLLTPSSDYPLFHCLG